MRDPQFLNRTVVLGQSYDDARLHAKSVESPVLVSAESHRYTILGGVAGMHVAKVLVTPAAHRGPNYELAREALQRCVQRSGGEFVNLTSEGATYGSL